jgi:phosphatidylinositol glycan class S
MGNQLRLRVLIAFSLLALVCAPVWYFTTRVPRAELPFYHVNLIAGRQPAESNLIVRVALPRRCAAARLSDLALVYTRYSFKLEPVFLDAELAAPDAHADPHGVLLEQSANLSPSRSGIYSIVAVSDPSVVPTWGAKRVAWFGVDRTASCGNVVDSVRALIDMHIYRPADLPHSPRRVAVKSAGLHHATFTLLSSDPQTARVSWNFAEAERLYLAPLLRKLARIAKIVVTSQVQHFAPLVTPAAAELERRPELDGGEYIVDTAAVQQFVDPNSWRLDSIESNASTIHFVVFVPPAATPLRLRNADGQFSRTNAFLLPQWGGVVVRNLPRDAAARALESHQPARLAFANASDLAEEMGVFAEQLKRLLSATTDEERVAGSTGSPLRPRYVPAPSGIADWQVDWMLRERMSENIVATKSTLMSLARLVEQLPTMKVLDHIRLLMQDALLALNSAESQMSNSEHDTGYLWSTHALVNAEAAFFDRDMLAMLYYPDEHNLAIILSFFLPMSLPFLSAIWSEFQRRREKRRKAALENPPNPPPVEEPEHEERKNDKDD